MSKKESLAARAIKIKVELDNFLKNYTYSSGDIALQLIYNANYKVYKSDPFSYYLQKGQSYSVPFSLKELSDLKTFLNNIDIME